MIKLPLTVIFAVLSAVLVSVSGPGYPVMVELFTPCAVLHTRT